MHIHIIKCKYYIHRCMFMYMYAYIHIYQHVHTHIDFITYTNIEYIFVGNNMYVHIFKYYRPKEYMLSLVRVLKKKKIIFSKCKIDV